MVWRDSFVIVATILGGILALVIYFIPTYLAFKRKHPSKIFILILNLFLGWTFLGYIIALIWALYPQNRRNTVNSENMNLNRK